MAEDGELRRAQVGPRDEVSDVVRRAGGGEGLAGARNQVDATEQRARDRSARAALHELSPRHPPVPLHRAPSRVASPPRGS